MTAKEEWKSWFTGLVRDGKDKLALITLTILVSGLFLYCQYHAYIFLKDKSLLDKFYGMVIFIPMVLVPFMIHKGSLFLLHYIQQLFHMVIVRPVVWVIYKLVH